MTSPTLLHRCRLALLHTLWVLLALGPFLHAHYGSSSRTGFHMDEVSQAVSHLPHLGHTTELSQADAPESPALGVATSHTREVSDPDHNPLSSAPSHPVHPDPAAPAPLLANAWQHPPRTPSAPYRAGLPPPALAPPLSFLHA
ncbi:hypothetical protein [Limnohabitans sp. JirII-29]|uniref:hypothetical protein n=1 Tax=Limnohabitans sp. JirII-29 TaxID=1835756 RepID=UPI000D33CC13|nr:hypothetical protein [Limnohabitans sp. JirII-29]